MMVMKGLGTIKTRQSQVSQIKLIGVQRTKIDESADLGKCIKEGQKKQRVVSWFMDKNDGNKSQKYSLTLKEKDYDTEVHLV